jgi:hypothetical protein
MSLSASSGAPGTSVTVVATGCTKPVAQADTLAWHDHFYDLHDVSKTAPLGVFRRIPVTRTSRTTVRASFVVRPSDHLGRGLLVLFCGGDGNALAHFTVTR